MAAETLTAVEVVGAYKSLAGVERVFRIFNGDLDVRPIHHRKADRVRAHFFLCMLAHYLEWHLLDRLAPMLFVDDDKAAAQAARPSPVAPAERSQQAKAKDATKQTPDGDPVHSLPTLLADLATICVNRVQPTDTDRPDSTWCNGAATPSLRAARSVAPPRRRVVRHPRLATLSMQVRDPARPSPGGSSVVLV